MRRWSLPRSTAFENRISVVSLRHPRHPAEELIETVAEAFDGGSRALLVQERPPTRLGTFDTT